MRRIATCMTGLPNPSVMMTGWMWPRLPFLIWDAVLANRLARSGICFLIAPSPGLIWQRLVCVWLHPRPPGMDANSLCSGRQMRAKQDVQTHPLTLSHQRCCCTKCRIPPAVTCLQKAGAFCGPAAVLFILISGCCQQLSTASSWRGTANAITNPS